MTTYAIPQKPQNSKVLGQLSSIAKDFTVCPRCEAQPTKDCKSVPTGKKTGLHMSRLAPVIYGYNLGRERS